MRTSNAERQSERRSGVRAVGLGRGLRALALGALAFLGVAALLATTPAGAQTSSDASLSGLELSGYAGGQQPSPVIALRPGFDSATLSYGASTTSTSQVRLRATASQAGATIRVDGQTVASGAYSQALRLSDNTPKRIEVRVTAADGTTERVYAVTVTNNPQADLNGLSLSPVEMRPSIFVRSQQAYRAWATYSVESVQVTATRRYGVETLTVNGQPLSSGQASQAIALEVGANLITVTATAPDQYTTKSYTITVTRASAAQSSDASLSGITVWKATAIQPNSNNDVLYEGDPLTVTPSFTSAGRDYYASQTEANGPYVAVAATTTAPGAKSIEVSGPKVTLEAREPKSEVVSGEASGPWQLTLGMRPITITVTSLDGTNTETYQLIVTYGAVSDPSGLRLSAGDGTLTAHWNQDGTPTAPDYYQFRWRKAGETTWLNLATWSRFKTSYASDAPQATAADGGRLTTASTGSKRVTGLENGVEYEVQARTVRYFHRDLKVMNFLRSDWRSVRGTAGAAKTALAITPSSPSREYGGVDDLSYTVSGLAEGDAATDVLTGALSRAAGDDVGSYAIGMGTLAVASAYASKYELASAPTTSTYEITARPIPSVSGVTVESRDEDGTTTARFDTSAAEGTDVLPDELADFRAGGLVVRGSFPTSAAGTHNLAVSYSLRDQGSFRASNYSLTQTTATLQGELFAVETQPACRPAVNGDYDRDDDGLIEICNLDQLNAIRFDSNGDGDPQRGMLHEYTRVFPGIVASGPGCPNGCQGYELVVDLDFDTNRNGRADAGDRYWNDGRGWDPMPVLGGKFNGTLDGNGYSISNLYINKPMKRFGLGLFYALGPGGVIRNLHLEDVRILGGCDAIGGLVGGIHEGALVKNVHVTGEVRPWPNAGYDVGLIAGRNGGRIEDSSASGTVVTDRVAGMLAGKNHGTILRSSASGAISGDNRIGGLVGVQGRGGLIRSSTADVLVTGTEFDVGGMVGLNWGNVWTSMSSSTVRGTADSVGGLVGTNQGYIVASYATGQVSSSGEDVGGLVGYNDDYVEASYSTGQSSGGGLIGKHPGEHIVPGRVKYSYWDVDTSGTSSSDAGAGLTTVSMLTPSGYTGIYEQWNVDLDRDGHRDDPWVFSADGSEYPLLRQLNDVAGAAPSGGIVLTADAVPAQETADDLILTAIALPGAVKISPAFASTGNSFTITLPPRMAEVTLYGRFEAAGAGNAYLAVAPDLGSFDVFDAQSVDDHLLAQLSGDSDGAYQVRLDNGESQTLQAGVFKWKPDEVNQAPFSDHSLKRIYTITLTRADFPTDDAKLSDLLVSPGSIAFGRDIFSYRIDVASTVNAVAVTPRTSDPEATVTVAGSQPGQSVQLEPGSNVIEIVVTARDGITTQTYRLIANRALDTKMRLTAVADTTQPSTDDMKVTGLALPQGFTITPDFSPDHLEYQVSAPLAWSEIEVVARWTTPFNGVYTDSRGCANSPLIFASPSFEQSMTDYQNARRVPNRPDWPLGIIEQGHKDRPFGRTFELTPGVSSQIAVTLFKWRPCEILAKPFSSHIAKTYTFTVTRGLPADTDASLYQLLSSAGPITLIEGQAEYAITLAHTVTSVTVTPKPLHPSATVSVNGTTADIAVDLDYGANLIQIKVTAADGATTKTYSLTVTRLHPRVPAASPQIELEVGLSSLTVNWEASPSHTDSPIDFYEVRLLNASDGTVTTRKFKVADLNGDLSTSYSSLTGGVAYTIGVRSGNDGGTSDWLEIPVTMPLANELSGLTMSADDYGEERNASSQFTYVRGTEGYQVLVPTTMWYIYLKPTVFHPQAKVAINGAAVTSTWTEVKLAAGANTVTVVVSVPGSQARTYTLHITRETPPRPNTPISWTVGAWPNSVSTGWSPSSYNTHEVDSWDLELIAADGTKKQVSGKFNDETFDWNGQILSYWFSDLVSGATYTIRIRAINAGGVGDWSTSRVTLPVSAGLEGLSLTAITRAGGSSDFTVQPSPGFSQERTAYTLSLPRQVIGLRLDPVVTRPKTVTIDGKDPGRNSNRYVTLKRGKAVEINVVVTQGTTTRTYTITATVAGDADSPRVASAIDDISRLEPGDRRGVTLTGVFTDPNNDDMTIRAESSDTDVATVLVAGNYSSLTVVAKQAGTATITVTADDGNGGTVSDTFTVTVEANTVPTVASSIADVGGLRVDDTRNVALTGVFTDADGDSLTLEAESSDTDVATATVASGFQSLTVTAKKIGTATITVTANDGDGGTVSDTFTVTVAANAAPTVASSIADVGGLRVDDTRNVSLSGVFTDPEGDSLTLTAESDDTDVATVTVASGFGSLTVTAKKIGTATITVTADDGKGGTVSDAFTVTIGANAVPTISSAIADVSGLRVDDTRRVSLTGVFTDADSDSLTLTAESDDTDVATVTVATDQSSLTVTAKKIGTATITVTAADGNGPTVADTFTATVKANSVPAVASAIADVSGLRAEDTRQVSLAGVFTDADGDTLTITAKSSDTAVATVTVAADQSSLTVTAKKNGTATITVTAADGRGASGIDNFTVTVSANAPAKRARTLDNVGGLRADDSRKVSLAGVFTDADGDSLTITAKSSDTAVATVSVATDGSSLTVTAKKIGTATITVTADDGNGGTATASFTVTVRANSAPTVSSAIADVSGVEPDDTRQVTLSGVFSDADSDSLTITAESDDTAVATVTVATDGSSLTVTARKEGAATITVTATDGRGGSVSDAFTVAVSPSSNNAPTVASGLADQAQFRAGDSIEVSLAGVFEDADGDALTLSASSSNNEVATASVSGETLTVRGRGGGTATITVTAADGKGGSVSASFTVPVKRNAVPTTLASIQDVAGLAEQTEEQVPLRNAFKDAENDRLTITALSSNPAVATVSVAADYSSLTLRGVSEGTATITVTADDGRGGRASQTFTVMVEAASTSQPEPEPTEEQSEVGASDSEPEEEQDVLVRFDANGDGVISGSEYRSALAYLGNGVTVADLMRLRQAWIDGGYQQ